MQIDWFTFAAQIINFLVLVWLLKKFLYKPVLAAMEKRKAALTARHQEAEEQKRVLEKEHSKLKHMQLELETSVEQEMAKARQDADALKNQLVAEVRQEAEAIRKQWLAAVEKEKKSFLDMTSKTISRQFEMLSRNALADLADESLEARVIQAFIKRIREDGEVLNMLQSTLNKPISIFSSFQISQDQKQSIEETITALAGKALELNFILDESMIAGIALEADGKKVRWDLQHYLENFQKEVEKSLQKVQEVS